MCFQVSSSPGFLPFLTLCPQMCGTVNAYGLLSDFCEIVQKAEEHLNTGETSLEVPGKMKTPTQRNWRIHVLAIVSLPYSWVFCSCIPEDSHKKQVQCLSSCLYPPCLLRAVSHSSRARFCKQASVFPFHGAGRQWTVSVLPHCSSAGAREWVGTQRRGAWI